MRRCWQSRYINRTSSQTIWKLLDAVVFSYERIGDPDSALRFLQERMHGALRRTVAERYALVAERKGDDDLALRTYRDLEREYGPSAAYGMKIATMLYARTQFDAALAALDEAKRAAASGDGDFWRLYALLATTVQNPNAVNEGYRALLAGGGAGADDYEIMAGFLQRPLPRSTRDASPTMRTGMAARRACFLRRYTTMSGRVHGAAFRRYSPRCHRRNSPRPSNPRLSCSRAPTTNTRPARPRPKRATSNAPRRSNRRTWKRVLRTCGC